MGSVRHDQSAAGETPANAKPANGGSVTSQEGARRASAFGRAGANGVFGRNRSAKTTSVKVVRTAKGVEPEMTVDEMVKKGLEALKMKRGTYALVARPVEVKGIFESFLLFSETVLTKGSV